MNNIPFHSNDFYESYVLGKLSETEESLFEEHLLFCKECQQQLEATENIILSIKKQAQIKKSKTKSIKPLLITTGIAASILLLVGFAYMYFITKDVLLIPEVAESKQERKAVGTILKKDSIDYEVDTISLIIKEPDKNQLIAENYKPLPLFENAIENRLRSDDFIVINPTNNYEIAVNDSILFEWKNSNSNLLLVIFNNRGELIFEKKENSPFTLQKKLMPGLYYWQLENENEAIYTGKFIVK